MTVTYLPSSIYVGGASGNLSPTFYIPATNTNSAGAIEGIGVVGSLTSSTAPYSAVLQFNLASTSTGALTLRTLTWANATSGKVLWTANDGVTAPASPGVNNIGATTLTAESQSSVTSTAADVIYETNQVLTTSPTSKGILTIRIDFNSTGSWTQTATAVFQFSVTQ